MDGHVIMDICDRWNTGCLTPHLIDWTDVEHVANFLLLHWRYLEYVFWWIPIVFIWISNVLTCLNLVIDGIPSNKYTCRYTIDIVIWVLKYSSIPSGLFWSVESSKIGMPKYQYLLGFIKSFPIMLPNHKTWPNIIIMTSPDSIVYEVAPVHIGILTCSEYSAGKGATIHFSDVNDIVRMFITK